MVFLFALPFPVLVALYLGLRAGRRDPQGFREFWREVAVAVAWALSVVFLWHCLWITSLSQLLGKKQLSPARFGPPQLALFGCRFW